MYLKTWFLLMARVIHLSVLHTLVQKWVKLWHGCPNTRYNLLSRNTTHISVMLMAICDKCYIFKHQKMCCWSVVFPSKNADWKSLYIISECHGTVFSFILQYMIHIWAQWSIFSLYLKSHFNALWRTYLHYSVGVLGFTSWLI